MKITKLNIAIRRVWTCSLILAGSLAAFAFAAPSYGDSLTYSFTGTAGPTGSTTDTLTSDGVTISATGYAAANVTEQLYIRNDEDQGLGLANSPFHEIDGGAFIQLNLSNLWAQNPTSVSLTMADADEKYNVWGSNSAGAPGTLLLSNASAAEISLLGFSGYNYITISSSAGSVVITSLTATDGSSSGGGPVGTPEPAMLTLLALGVVSAGFVAYRSGAHSLTQA